jgi:hypothetical protein
MPMEYKGIADRERFIHSKRDPANWVSVLLFYIAGFTVATPRLQ